MILLDTHIWVWWCHGDSQLPVRLMASLEMHSGEGFAVSAISCWEVAKLVERERLVLPMEIEPWFDMALDGSGITLLPISPIVAAASTRLPGSFHRDPADQLIVATARVHELRLATLDARIRAYQHVRLLEDEQIHDG